MKVNELSIQSGMKNLQLIWLLSLRIRKAKFGLIKNISKIEQYFNQ